MPSSAKHVRLMAMRRRGAAVKSEPAPIPQRVACRQEATRIGVLASVCIALCFNFFQLPNFMSTTGVDSMSTRRLSISGSSVVVLDNFLPLELAVRWRNVFQSEWDREPSGFMLATNNDGGGRSRGGNAKHRSHKRKTERRRIAEQMHRHNMFSYAKHELSPDHKVLKEIADYMLLNDTRHRIAVALNTTADRLDANELSDLFATSFGEGDFLSAHSDGYSGTYAFVASLAAGPDWIDEFGGSLDMYCRDKRKWCAFLGPQFRSVTVFRTRLPPGPNHRVRPVTSAATKAGWFRHGFTGWYRDVGDVMTEEELAERNAMRGVNT